MALVKGAHLGTYEIQGPIGAGGMGEVYKARDARLNRDVAIKVLPDLFSRDPDRMARFEREAQAVASLSHPNVLAIHEFGMAGTTSYAVMELLDGETLRERIARGPQPARRVVDLGVQIARGLAAAHEKRIVHRDLKPENIFVTRDGQAKILDFGLARQIDKEVTAGVTMAATDAGSVMGTVGYMAPEQVRGLPADARSDIFALGTILYELVSGRQAFHRESPAETMTAIAREDPPSLSSAGASALPPSLERIIWRCLEKDPAARFQSCQDLAFALESATTDSSGSAVASRISAGPRPRFQRMAWGVAGAVLGAVLASALLWRGGSPGAPTALARYDISLPTGARLELAGRPTVAVSPDGSTIVFVALVDEVARLYVRRSTDREAKAIPGTDGATNPVFSPDGRSVAFTAGLDLKKVTLDGGATTLATGIVTDDSRGLTWTDDNQIVFAPDPVRGLFRVSADGGGQVSVLTEPDVSKDERTHRWPDAIRGHKVVLVTVGASNNPDDYDTARIDAVRTDNAQRVAVLDGASMARYLPGGRLVLARGGSLYTVAFDVDSLKTSGPQTLVEEGVGTDFTSGAAHFSFGQNGTLAYVHGPINDNQRRLFWVDRTGASTRIDLPTAVYGDPSFSPDGSKLAVIVGPSGGGDIYVYDIERKTFLRLTFDSKNTTPIWSADGQTIYYASIQPMRRAKVMRKPADGSRDAEQVYSTNSRIYPGYLIDPTTLIAMIPDLPGPPPRRSDIVQVRLGSTDASTPVVATEGQDYGPARSPDGRFLAYASDTAGRPEIFVRDQSGSGARWQVSFTGGEEAKWSPDGRELYYRRANQLMVTAVDLTPTFRASPTKVLIDGIYNLRVESGVSYAVHPKTGRFLMIGLAGEETARLRPALRVVLNWFKPPQGR